MRAAMLFLVAACLAAPLAANSAQAANLRPLGIETAQDAVVEAAVRCGPRAHYVRGHRARNGQFIRGQCVRFRPHR